MIFQRQADAVLSQADPVSATYYTVLATTKNVRIRSITANVTWAVTQPNPLRIRITIDGQTIIHTITNPVSATNYAIARDVGTDSADEASQYLATAYTAALVPLQYEGRSVKIEVSITWATTQPTPLVCRVKYAKIP